MRVCRRASDMELGDAWRRHISPVYLISLLLSLVSLAAALSVPLLTHTHACQQHARHVVSISLTVPIPDLVP